MIKQMKFPGLKSDKYYIFSDAKIWSSHKKDFLKFNEDRDGYYRISLTINGKKRKIYVHKLMEYNFMDISLKKNFNDPTIDHIDSNRKNNKYTNLRYLERKENTRRGKHYCNIYPHSKLNPEDVHLICKLIKYNWNIKDISELFSVSNDTIYQIKNKKAWVWIGNLYL